MFDTTKLIGIETIENTEVKKEKIWYEEKMKQLKETIEKIQQAELKAEPRKANIQEYTFEKHCELNNIVIPETTYLENWTICEYRESVS